MPLALTGKIGVVLRFYFVPSVLFICLFCCSLNPTILGFHVTSSKFKNKELSILFRF